MNQADYPFGPCECRCAICNDEQQGPAAYSVIRDGKTMLVCTYCDLTTDAGHCVTLPTKDTDLSVYEQWDSLGHAVLESCVATGMPRH